MKALIGHTGLIGFVRANKFVLIDSVDVEYMND